MLNFSKKEQPEERIIPKTFCRSFEFMFNFQLLQFEIWLIFPFHLTGLVRRSISSANSTIMFQIILTHFCVWNFDYFSSLLFESKQIRGIHNFS